MWNNSHWKLPGNLQKDSCTTKAISKIYTELGRKRRETIRLEPVPLGGDLGEKGDFTGGDLSWGMSCSSHILCTPILGLTQERQVPLAGWRAGETNRRAVGSLDSAHEELECSGWLLKQGREGGLKNSLNSCPFSMQLPSPPACAPAWTKRMLQPHLLHTAVAHATVSAAPTPHKGKSSALRRRDNSDLKQLLSRVGTAITGSYTGSTSEVALS